MFSCNFYNLQLIHIYFYSICRAYHDSSDGAASSRRLPMFLCVIATCVASTTFVTVVRTRLAISGWVEPAACIPQKAPRVGASARAARRRGSVRGQLRARPVARQRPNCIMGSNAILSGLDAHMGCATLSVGVGAHMGSAMLSVEAVALRCILEKHDRSWFKNMLLQ